MEDSIREVSLSTDGGRAWEGATLGKDVGKYSFREWASEIRFSSGEHEPIPDDQIDQIAHYLAENYGTGK